MKLLSFSEDHRFTQYKTKNHREFASFKTCRSEKFRSSLYYLFHRSHGIFLFNLFINEIYKVKPKMKNHDLHLLIEVGIDNFAYKCWKYEYFIG